MHDKLKVISGISALIVGLLGGIAIIGWVYNIPLLKSIIPGFVTMKPNAAVCFMLSGIALWLLNIKEKITLLQKTIIFLCSLLILLVGLLTLSEYIFNTNLGIDELLFKDDLLLVYTSHPGRMSPFTALNFLLAGITFVLKTIKPSYYKTNQTLALFILMSAIFALGEYIYASEGYYILYSYTRIALHTVFGFIILSVGFVASQGKKGIAAIFMSDTTGGIIAKSLLPLIIILPIFLKWLQFFGERNGWFGHDFGGALFTTVVSVIFFILVIRNAAIIIHTETERKLVFEELTKSHERFFKVFDNNSIGLIISDASSMKFESVNATFTKYMGYAKEDVIGKTTEELELVKSDDREKALLQLKKSGTIKDLEILARRKNGEDVWCSFSSDLMVINGKEVFLTSLQDISERKKREFELKNANEQFSKIFDKNPIGMILINKDTNTIHDVNETFLSYFGYTKEEVIGSKMNELMFISIESVKKIAELLDKQGFVKELEVSGRKKNGETFFTIASVYVILINNKKLGLTSILDITERKKMEMEVHTAKERFLKVFENNAIGMVIADLESHKFQFVNEVFVSKLGYTKEEAIGKTVIELNIMDEPEREKISSLLHQNGIIKELEVILRKKNGGTFISLFSSQIMVNGQKSVLSSIQDISERKKAEYENKIAQERFRSVFEASPFGIVIVNNEGKIIMINERLKLEFGYQQTELLGQNLEILIPERYRTMHRGYVTDYFKAPVSKSMSDRRDLAALRKNGTEFPAEIELSPVKIENELMVMASINNITERKKTQIELKQKSEELIAANKELQQFVYVASHDLQEPLRTITNFSGLIAGKYSGKIDTDANQYLNFIVTATTKMQNLIKDLLDFSRVGKNITFVDINCNTILQEVLTAMDASIKESKAKIVAEQLPVLKGTELMLKQLFQNLISNAIKFHKKNTIPEIAITVEEKGSEYIFSIKDNGIGIEEKNMGKLFVIFQRLNTELEYPGTGIGLATCKRIVTMHNGKIWVESKFGEGSNFFFSLPKLNP